jgi:hypothetical protein
MRRVDAAAFVVTALSVLIVNAVAAVGLGCSCYLAGAAWRRLHEFNAQGTPLAGTGTSS